jgi:hypothetical protein
MLRTVRMLRTGAFKPTSPTSKTRWSLSTRDKLKDLPHHSQSPDLNLSSASNREERSANLTWWTRYKLGNGVALSLGKHGDTPQSNRWPR